MDEIRQGVCEAKIAGLPPVAVRHKLDNFQDFTAECIKLLLSDDEKFLILE
jgi:hypothetical protein